MKWFCVPRRKGGVHPHTDADICASMTQTQKNQGAEVITSCTQALVGAVSLQFTRGKDSTIYLYVITRVHPIRYVAKYSTHACVHSP
jgi:hypothetical protein